MDFEKNVNLMRQKHNHDTLMIGYEIDEVYFSANENLSFVDQSQSQILSVIIISLKFDIIKHRISYCML